MKVKELIKLLNKLPQDLEVFAPVNYEHWGFESVESRDIITFDLCRQEGSTILFDEAEEFDKYEKPIIKGIRIG